ncbi:unnamed protein product [Schistocephalus solidus]|uniref:E3 ubiquitin-protein ligase n=1 Tax=Schistocephalus solidus TaxID=70667 RepID=A0A3P7EH41_SCHSO|nr:unnamed protein product [Schistocephalus solidus]
MLYQRIRTVAFKYCQPKPPVTEDIASLATENDGLCLSEYKPLLTSIFADFEAFLALKKCEKPAVGKAVSTKVPEQQASDGDAHLAALNALLTAVCPKVRSSCGRLIAAQEDAFVCKDCSIGEAGVLCHACLVASIHARHNYKMLPYRRGYCACGYDEAWTSGVCCRIHGGNDREEGQDLPVSDDDDDGPQTLRTVEEEQRQEMERLQRRLDSLPLHVVKRCTYLLRPLLDSTILVLFELIQGSPRRTSLAPLSRLSKSTSGTNDPDCAEVVHCWLPPFSHLPSASSSKDAAQVAVLTATTTSSKGRAFDVEARCRAQQARARRLHPLLFAAPARRRFTALYSAIFYSSPFHPPNEAHLFLWHILGCPDLLEYPFFLSADRDGRVPLLPPIPLQVASEFCEEIVSFKPNSSARPLRANLVDCNIYALEQFFMCFLRWLKRLASVVLPLRPLICNAMLGRYVEFASGASGGSSARASEMVLLQPGEMLVKPSLLAGFFDQFHALYLGVRKSVRLCDRDSSGEYISLHQLIITITITTTNTAAAATTIIVVGILFATSTFLTILIIFSTAPVTYHASFVDKHFDRLTHVRVYDEILGTAVLTYLNCQIFADPKLARHLLLQNNAPLRLVSYLCRTFAANSVPLPGFYATQHSRKLLADHFNPDYTFQFFPPALQNRLRALRNANPVAWRRAYEYTRLTVSTDVSSLLEQPRYPLTVLVWMHEAGLIDDQMPFVRAVHSVDTLRGLLTGLMYRKPLVGESESSAEGWWDVDSRDNFLAYFRCLLELLCYIQDTNSMQRTLERYGDAGHKLFDPTILSKSLYTIVSLSSQLASTDRTLLLSAIRETRDAFEQRVGVIDSCFRVGPFARTQVDSLVGHGDEKIENISFQALGATSEVYEYDVAKMRVSIVQPLPRLLAALYGYGIEMGLPPTLLGLADEGFANLVIERPLQMVAVFAQCSANMWLPKDDLVLSPMLNMPADLSMETVARDYQLLQQVAAVLPPDELIVRMVHKLNLKDYLSDMSWQPNPGSVQAAESLLRVLHFIVTSRSRHDVGYFDPSIVKALPSSPQLFPPNFNDLEEWLEIEYGLLVDDVIHQLCMRPMTLSEVLLDLPLPPPRSCLHEAPPYSGLHAPTGCKWKTLTDNEKAVADRHALSNDDLKRPVSLILQQVATQTLVGEERKFILRPDVLSCRFDLFYPSHSLSGQAETKEAVIQTLTQARETNTNLFPVNFPIPPPPPRPRRRFVSHLNAPILRLLRCSTFVRLLRQLLDIGIEYRSQQSKWSQPLLELILHLIIIALYEDLVAFAETGEKPFLEAVRQVPEESESAEELERLAELRHWKRQNPPASMNHNCLVRRLEVLLEKPCHNHQAGLIEWTLKLWKSIAENQSASSLLHTPGIEVTEGVSKVEEECRLKAERGSSLLAKMASMQRKLFAAYSHFEDVVKEADDKTTVQSPQTKIDGVEPAGLSDDRNDLSRLAVLGPTVYVDRLTVLEKKPASVTCVICLKDESESSEHGIVAAALAARSSVLSASLPCPHIVFSDSGNTTRLTYSTSADCTWPNRALAAIATSTVAAAVGNERMLPSSLPHLFANLPSGVPVEVEKRTRKKNKKKIKTSRSAVFSSERLGTAPLSLSVQPFFSPNRSYGCGRYLVTTGSASLSFTQQNLEIAPLSLFLSFVIPR